MLWLLDRFLFVISSSIPFVFVPLYFNAMLATNDKNHISISLEFIWTPLNVLDGNDMQTPRY